MRLRRSITQERRHVACRSTYAGVGIALGLALMSVSEARAATYRVYTNSAASSMSVNANDGQCSLAEAVLHVNGQNGNTTYCTNAAPGSSEHRIELLQSPNRPYATNHFQITSLTITTTTRVSIAGFGAFIDSSKPSSGFTYSAFVIGARGAPPSQWPTVFFERVTLTNISGSNGGRLVENFGTLQLYGVSITKGDATGSHHTTGRGGGIFNAGTISVAQNSLITGNKARKGGGIYNDAGNINELAVTISDNTATLAGGGIYNISTNSKNTGWTNGRIVTNGATIQNNKARAGGGIFNRGLVELLEGSSITGNSTTTTGSSEETCTGSASCDGLGGGVLSVHISATATTPSGSDTRFQLRGSTISNNTASTRGGAIYSVGVLELAGNSINGNTAPTGAAFYVTAPTDGSQQYCNIYGDIGVGPTTINSNWATASGGYSIVAGGPGGASDFRACSFKGLPTPGQPTYMTAAGNSSPNFCAAAAVDGSYRCPQPCGGTNQACCPTAPTCNTGLACIEPAGGGWAFCRVP
jgi:predicted outer membrane repeat protein